MRRLLVILLLALSSVAFSQQTTESVVVMTNKTGNFTSHLFKNQLMTSLDTNIFFRLIHDVYVNQNLDTVYRNNWLKIIGGSGGSSTRYKWQYEVPADNLVSFVVSFPIYSTAVVYYNNTPLRNSQWSGVGSSTITVMLNTKQYDFITIVQ